MGQLNILKQISIVRDLTGQMMDKRKTKFIERGEFEGNNLG